MTRSSNPRKTLSGIALALVAFIAALGLFSGPVSTASADTGASSQVSVVPSSDPVEGQPLDPNTLYNEVSDACDSDAVDVYYFADVAKKSSPSKHWGAVTGCADYRKGSTRLTAGFVPTQRYIDLEGKEPSVTVKYTSTKGKDKILKQHTGRTDGDTISPITLYKDGRLNYTVKKPGTYCAEVHLVNQKNAFGCFKVKVKK